MDYATAWVASLGFLGIVITQVGAEVRTRKAQDAQREERLDEVRTRREDEREARERERATALIQAREDVLILAERLATTIDSLEEATETVRSQITPELLSLSAQLREVASRALTAEDDEDRRQQLRELLATAGENAISAVSGSSADGDIVRIARDRLAESWAKDRQA
ncbi:hypothetical protein V6K52_03735 [Knoellia sp. S7-12]|uniref:hypothetical protein n=1 Tax=Knoellia sp. S7-12 TaxID=3126698 RepID=UPI0033672330